MRYIKKNIKHTNYSISDPVAHSEAIFEQREMLQNDGISFPHLIETIGLTDGDIIWLTNGPLLDKIIEISIERHDMFEKQKKELYESRKLNGVCTYCGNKFQGLLSKTCTNCKKPKNY